LTIQLVMALSVKASFFSCCLHYSSNCHAIHAFICLASTLAVSHPRRLAYTPFCLYLYLSLVEIAFLHSDNCWTHCPAPGTHQGLCVPFASLHCFLSRNITALDHFLDCPSMMIFHCFIPCLVTQFSECALSNCCVILCLMAHGDTETPDSSLGLSIDQNNPFN